MSSKKPKFWLVPLDTNLPYIYMGKLVCKWGERVVYWDKFIVGQIDCKSIVLNDL